MVMLLLILCCGLEQNTDSPRICIFGGCGKERRNWRKNETFFLGRGGEIHLKTHTNMTQLCLFCFFFYSDGNLEGGIASFIYFLLPLFYFLNSGTYTKPV